MRRAEGLPLGEAAKCLTSLSAATEAVEATEAIEVVEPTKGLELLGSEELLLLESKVPRYELDSRGNYPNSEAVIEPTVESVVDNHRSVESVVDNHGTAAKPMRLSVL
tara:strand:- start:7712 stop:8035 length:324 start_codon:yes stop_codon:yes gene_type:complete